MPDGYIIIWTVILGAYVKIDERTAVYNELLKTFRLQMLWNRKAHNNLLLVIKNAYEKFALFNNS